MEEETSQILFDSEPALSEEDPISPSSKTSRTPMLALADPIPKGCTGRTPTLTRYLAAYLSQSGDPHEEEVPKQPSLLQCTTDTPQELDPTVTAFHDSLLHLDQPTSSMQPGTEGGTTAWPREDLDEEDEEPEEPAYEATGTQNPLAPSTSPIWGDRDPG